jgi:hypothetical protein
MISNDILLEKGFQKEPDATAIAAKIMIAKIRRHIEQDNCRCCRRILEGD